MLSRAVVLFVAALCYGAAPALAQTAEQREPDKSSDLPPKGRLVPRELQQLYERYFLDVCEKDKRCDGRCKETFDLIERKEILKLHCS
jgi:hypothetical protein